VTTVLVVDDHPLVRAGLTALVATTDDLHVVGGACSGQQAIDLAAELEPDVVLMDLSMPGMDGVEATRRILTASCGMCVVVLTSFADQDRVSDALAAGAVGYLLKDCDPRDVLAAIRSAALGHAPIDPRVARTLLPASAPRPGHALSERETQVLRLLTQGLTNRQIARTLAISENTVKVHATNLFRRIGVSDRTSAAMWARDHLPALVSS
jgi:DNA-binding NarL/FixJ family response regulator